MKKNIIIALPFLLMVVSAFSQQGFQVQGKLDGMGGENLILSTQSDDNRRPQTVMINTDGTFQIQDTVPTSAPQEYSLMDPNGMTLFRGGAMAGIMLKFLAQNGDHLTITGNRENFDFANVTGSKLNAQLMELRAQTRDIHIQENKIWDEVKLLMQQHNPANRSKIDSLSDETIPYEAKMLEIKLRYIQQHPDELVSAVTLADITQRMKVADVETVYNSLSKENQESSFGMKVLDEIGRGKATIAVDAGKPAVNFVKTDMNGKTIRLSDLRGKYVLLDFWGSWCAPCRASHPHLKELYAKYGSQGLVVIGIAEEKTTNKSAWLKAIKEDGLPWIQIMNDEVKDQVDVVKLYGIQGFPTKILIDKNGNILDRVTGTTVSAPTHAEEQSGSGDASVGTSGSEPASASSDAVSSAASSSSASSTMSSSATSSGKTLSQGTTSTAASSGSGDSSLYASSLDKKLKEIFNN